jgi:selenide,water dikinase
MERSMRLGRCICDPKKPCPCDLLRERDVCLCAGERLEAPPGPVRLTRMVESAGCASKIDQASLKRLLSGLSYAADPRVLVGVPAGDDAGVFLLQDGLALVQTVDVFTPCVDDPYLFGQVAAANSLSDIYAMGGRPLTALSVVGFPLGTAPDDVLQNVLRGGLDKMAEAGVSVIGGHSIKDPEIKAGFAVTGLIDPDAIVTNAGVRPGDVLILTKPLGTGIIAFAAQMDRAPDGAVETAAASMCALNKAAADLMLESGAHACTDVTGFGLAGHLSEMARASGVDVEVAWDDLPLLPGVLDCVAQGLLSGGVERNRDSSGDSVECGDGVQPGMVDVCLDPQTSGGLLMAVAPEAAEELVERLRAAGAADAAVIGRAQGPGSGRILLTTRGRRPIPAEPERRSRTGRDLAAGSQRENDPMEEDEARECCAGDGHEELAGGAATARAQFGQFLAAANAPGALDAYTKQIVAIALAVLSKCEPCVKAHVRKARQMGISQAEIEEAAWMAIAFGGSPTMMFYDRLKEK